MNIVNQQTHPALQQSEACTPVGTSPVRVHTEWGRLEEVIVGTLTDARVPEWDPGLAAVIPARRQDWFREHAGLRFPDELLQRAAVEVDTLAHILASEGVTVRRPSLVELHCAVLTPYFTTGGGFYSAMPRDCLLAIGDQVIETPMAWRSRYFETFAFRDILRDYFVRGARWTAAPKPMLADTVWDTSRDSAAQQFRSAITESEPLFDAADFIRIGPDIVGQRSHVTNNTGITWLRRALGEQYRVHIYAFDDTAPMHIDTTILPLAPGKVLVNPVWVSRLPALFAGWDVLTPPPSVLPDTHPLLMTSKWIHMNVLMLDERRVLVEAGEEPLIKAFKDWGFVPISCPFRHFQSFGGSFHCATLDVRRVDEFRSYF